MPVITYPKNSKESLSEHFMVSEFRCPCISCNSILVNTHLVSLLEKLRGILGTPLKVNSGYRCEEYQQELKLRGYETSLGLSQHTLGNAADITTLEEGAKTGGEIAEAAVQAGFQAIGIGHSFCHLDTRTGEERRWFYTTR